MISPCYKRAALCLVCVFSLLLCTGLSQSAKKAKAAKHNPDAVRFIKEAAHNIYSPIREGLETLSFSRPMATPMGLIGMEHYNFIAPDKLTYKRDFNEQIPGIDEIRQAMSLDPKANQLRAEQTVSMYLGTFLTYRLDEFDVVFLESSADSVRIRCKAKPGTTSADSIGVKDMIFSSDGLIRKIKLVDKQGLTQTYAFTLKEKKDSGEHLLDAVEISSDTPTNPMKTKQFFFFDEIKGLQIVVKSEVEIAPMKQRIQFISQNLRINEPEPEAGNKEKNGEDKGKDSD